MERETRGWILAYGLIGVSIYFMLLAVSYMASEEPRVAASLLAALIGFMLLTAGSSIARSLILARAAGGE